jgi:tripeptide aminopeptidase
MEDIATKFIRYTGVDTPSSEDNFDVTPSTDCQFNLANMLAKELQALGLDVLVTTNAYVYSEIPANTKDATAKIGFIAHLDVVREPKGYGVKAQVHKNYRGGDITLANGNIIFEKDFPVLKNYVGQDIITSDGTTILGADDKAGVAEIMSLTEYLLAHPEIKHGKIGIAFTPDEEIGHGAKLFNTKAFDCDFAYTVDGEEIGEICYETFNGAAFDIQIKGVNIHPGQAKGKMINAIILANELISMLPESERPETTEGREGYYFVHKIDGNVECANVSGIIRDHDRVKFEERKKFIKDTVSALNAKYGERFFVTLRDQYYNCAEVIAPHMHLVDNAKAAMIKEGVTPLVSPIRGGTDGSSLSFMGLPCPNICTGGHNAHSTKEFIPVGSMQKVVKILLNIVQSYAK